MYISESPQLSFKHLLSSGGNTDFFQTFYGRDAFLFYLGRGALWQAVNLLHIGNNEKVLVPSYHCGVDIQSILQANAQIEFYRIEHDMSLDLDSIKEKIKEDTRAVFVIHYYGFPQDIESIRNLCRDRNIYLIEDCAHALFCTYHDLPLGLYGDVAIFSQRKALPLIDGGALIVNNPDISVPISLKKPDLAAVLNSLFSHLLWFLRKGGRKSSILTMLKIIKKRAYTLLLTDSEESYSTGMDFDILMGNIGISGISKHIMRNLSVETIISKRRSYYEYLLDKISDSDYLKICFSKLPEGTCPLFFPLRIMGDRRRDVQKYLQDSGIESFVFGEHLHYDLPKGRFPEAESLSKEILCLPIHQDMTMQELSYIVKIVNSIKLIHVNNTT